MSNSTLNIESDRDFLAVAIQTLASAPTLCADLYVKADENATPLLYRDRNLELARDELSKLADSGFSTVYIPQDQVSLYQKHLRDSIQPYLSDENVPTGTRLHFLTEAGRDMLQHALDGGNINNTVAAANKISSDMTTFIFRNDFAVRDLMSVLRHDYTTFTHSYNVAMYCLLLAKAFGIHDELVLESIGIAALLHDIGKLQIPLAILNKKGSLTEEEFDVIKRHPTDGFNTLSDRGDLSFEQLMIVYQHHEKNDGSGYPVGCLCEEIHPFARLCTVVDIFEALTAHRSYRKPLRHSEALEYLQQDTPQKLDKEFVKCWISLMKTVS